MHFRAPAMAVLTSLTLSACSFVWNGPEPNGEAILKEEKLRATPVVTRIEKPASPTDFKEDGEKSCAGATCVEKTEAHMGSGSVLRQLSCDSMGKKEYLASIPDDVTNASIPAETLPKCDRLTFVTIDQNLKNARIAERNGKWFRYEEISKIPGGYASFSKTSWCGGSKWTQKILSDSGTEITALAGSGALPYPETLKVGQKEFKAQDLSANDQSYYLWTFAKTVEFPKILSVKDDVSAEFEKYVLDRSFLAESYLFTFREYPGLRVKYLTKTTPSERIVFLWKNDAEVRKKMLQPVSNVLIDKRMTMKLLESYDPKRNHRLLVPVGRGKEYALSKQNYDWKTPIFQIDDDAVWYGYYLAYAWPWYEFEEFGDPCSVWLDNWSRELLKAGP